MTISKRKLIFLFVAVCCLASVIFSGSAPAADVKAIYFKAENCAKALEKSPEKKKYRSNWLNCIQQFTKVHQDDPAGPYAAASLYQAGVLYQEMYTFSRKSSDRQSAADLFQKIITGYPKSAYRNRARERLDGLVREAPDSQPAADPKKSGKAVAKPTEPESGKAPAPQPDKDGQKSPDPEKAAVKLPDPAKAGDKYAEAEACHQKLRDSAARKKYRCFWLECINAYYDAYHYDPSGPRAEAGLYMAGTLYEELYKSSYKEEDREEGRRLLQKVITEFPQGEYREKAAAVLLDKDISGVVAADKTLGTCPGEEENVQPSPAPSPAVDASIPGGMAVVRELRYWSNPSYTRVVIDTSEPVEFTSNLLKGDPVSGKPPRLYIDLQKSRLHRELSRQITVDDNLLKDIRAGQYTTSSVRVVVDIKSFKSYKVFSLQDPFRLVIDVSGEEDKSSVTETVERSMPIPGKGEKTTLAQQLGLSVGRIVIDPGHGGKDSGAPGSLKGIQEKKVVLDICRMLADRIRKELGCEVILTRNSDTFLTLEERTAIANMKNADLFISVHTNASRNRNAYGIETYILNLATDEDAMQVAALENSTSRKNISDLQTILQDLMQNAKKDESLRLAGYVQNALCGHMQKGNSRVKNKGVKQAPFYVLIGAQMPSILIETGFISNKEECQRLISPEYQRQLCDGILKGIKTYIERTTSTGFAPPAEKAPASM
ncbi:MAG: N-acetylmuramoyl-L-alanine amidase [Thermodesulfobacteriota bacterium]